MNCSSRTKRQRVGRLGCRRTLMLLTATLVGISAGAESRIGMAGAPVDSSASPFPAGIVASIVNAPIVPDGTTTGRTADFVINLDSSMDPAAPGRSLLAGRTIRVSLPEGFERDPAVPFRAAFTDPTCVPLNFQCNTMFLLQGWPQHPVGFPPPNIPGLWTVDFEEATNTIVLTALQNLLANPPSEPGIKQLHILLAGFANPRPGLHHVRVVAETGPNGEPEEGWGRLTIQPQGRPTVALAGAFNPGAPNTIYQTTTPGSPTPFSYDLLLWDRAGAPLLDVDVRQVAAGLALLVQGHRAVGEIDLETPPGADGHHVFNLASSFQIRAPISGVPTARLRVFFTAGNAAGEYVLRFRLLGGNVFEAFVIAR